MSEERSPFDSGPEGTPPLPVKIEPYADDDVILFGKYKGEPLATIQASYLLWLYDQRPLTDPRLEAYIQKNLSALKQECPDFVSTRR